MNIFVVQDEKEIMCIMILGASGYLGSNITEYFSKKGYNVICVVRPTSNISRLRELPCHIISSELNQVELFFSQDQVDWVINGVATYKPNDSLYGDMFASNVTFPLSILNLAIRYGIKNFMTMGTGLPDNFNMYSFTKAKFSDFGKYLSEKHKINFVDLRLEMFYGGKFEPDQKFMKASILRLISGTMLELTEGSQMRDIIHMDDVLKLIERLIKSQFVKGYRILPVGTGEKHAIKDIITYLARKYNSKSEIKFGAVETRPEEPDTLADISWYSEIGFNQMYSYFEGLDLEYENIQAGFHGGVFYNLIFVGRNVYDFDGSRWCA